MTIRILPLVAALTVATQAVADDDPFLWLEDIEGEKAMAWVEEQNQRSTKVLEAVPVYQPIYDWTLAYLGSDAVSYTHLTLPTTSP